MVGKAFRAGLADGTRASYSKGVRRLARFGLQLGLVHQGILTRPSELDLMFWVTSMAYIEQLSPSYISQLLTGVQNAFIEWGSPSPLKDARGAPLALLFKVMRGIKREKTKPRKDRLAITTVILKQLLRRLNKGRPGQSGVNYLCYRAMLTLGVYALLRQGEMTSSTTRKWDPLRQAARSSVTFVRDDDNIIVSMVFTCIASKCDPFRSTVELVVHATGTSDCPVQAMRLWLASRPRSKAPEPLFVHADGSYVTRGRLASVLSELLRECGHAQTKFSTHSMRIGGCVSLAAAGFGREVIAIYGRWASDSLLRYLKLGRGTLCEATLGMAAITQEQVEGRGKVGLRRN